MNVNVSWMNNNEIPYPVPAIGFDYVAAQCARPKSRASFGMLEANPVELYAIVDAVLRRRFDTVYAARLVLPRHWTTITPEQRQKFVEALYGSLVRRYSIGLLKHSETRVRVTPLRLNPVSPSGEDFVTVRTLVTLDNGTEVPVNYEMRWFERTWKVYDVNIEGRSYVLYYRGVYSQEIEAKGIDKIIEDLNAS